MPIASFSGKDRRRHKLYVTRNSEYHVRDGRVLGVRERRTGRWLASHTAIGMMVEGRLHGATLVPRPGDPKVGDRLYLAEQNPSANRGPHDIVTSTLLAVERPPPEVLAEYARLAAA